MPMKSNVMEAFRQVFPGRSLTKTSSFSEFGAPRCMLPLSPASSDSTSSSFRLDTIESLQTFVDEKSKEDLAPTLADGNIAVDVPIPLLSTVSFFSRSFVTSMSS